MCQDILVFYREMSLRWANLLLPESAATSMVDRTAVPGPSLPSPKIPAGHRRLPPPSLVVKNASMMPKESIDSGTYSEPLRRIAWRMSALRLKLEELVDFCGGQVCTRCHVSVVVGVYRIS